MKSCHVGLGRRCAILLTTVLALALHPSSATGSNRSCHGGHIYILQDQYRGPGFAQGFMFENEDDPTHGRVNYVDMDTAFARNLSYFTQRKFFMRADSTHVVPRGARGRDSVRIISRQAYRDSVLILDVAHMPEGCATWPAYWTLSKKGPWRVNNAAANLASLHTSPGCVMEAIRPMTGTTTSTNCDTRVNFNQGCGVSFSTPASYGQRFNLAGGGWYAMERDSHCAIKVWFWGRDDPNVPIDVQFATPGVRPDARWGTPDAVFLPDQCDLASHFDAHQVVFDLTFCGDYAGAVYSAMGCPGQCVDYVNNNPSAFTEAYWEINSLRVYTPFKIPFPLSDNSQEDFDASVGLEEV
ncbi:hypothetical protein AURDEDRAFT_55815 [Auricularia subglabra TFB-10046 SS5]|nr:hypothetical protein AURDEDRAFT_55815 [Auricularia subglabra TFB-10046 SS5]